MKLLSATIRPGNVMDVMENGNIKASAPGLFSFMEDPALLPPIMPWFLGSISNTYSKPVVGDEVWIMNFSDNPRQLYWFRKDRLERNTNIPFGEENVEVLCNRDVNGEWATIYFSDGSGWVIGKGESKVQITEKGDIVLTNDMPHRTIEISTKGISLGSAGGSAHPAAYGDNVEDALREICKVLSSVAIKALANPYTTAIGTELLAGIPDISGAINGISSNNVTID